VVTRILMPATRKFEFVPPGGTGFFFQNGWLENGDRSSPRCVGRIKSLENLVHLRDAERFSSRAERRLELAAKLDT